MKKNLSNENGATLDAYSTSTYNNSTSIHDGKKHVSSLQKTFINSIETSFLFSEFIHYTVYKFHDGEQTETCETPDSYGYQEEFVNSFYALTWNDQLCNLNMPAPIELEQEIINFINNW